ncbi:Ig-like domain-containing protein, partial [Dietzia sp. NPDC055343]
VLCTGQVAADGTVECPWTPTSTGTVQVTAHYAGDATTSASDSASATTITVVEAPDTEAPAAPTGITVAPQPATVGQTVTVSGQAETGSEVSVKVGGEDACEGSATGGTFTCEFIAKEGMDGQQVTVTATDAADNTSDTGNGGTLQVDPAVVDPTEPTITVTPAQPVAGQKVEIEVTGDAGEEVVIISGDREICRVTLDEDGNATCEWTPAAEGQTVLKVTVGDQTVEKTVTVRPASGGGGDPNGSGSLDSGSLGSLVGGTGGTSGSLGSLSSLGG